jgi:DNA primase
MLCRILTAIAGPSKFSVGELIDLCGLEKHAFNY